LNIESLKIFGRVIALSTDNIQIYHRNRSGKFIAHEQRLIIRRYIDVHTRSLRTVTNPLKGRGTFASYKTVGIEENDIIFGRCDQKFSVVRKDNSCGLTGHSHDPLNFKLTFLRPQYCDALRLPGTFTRE